MCLWLFPPNQHSYPKRYLSPGAQYDQRGPQTKKHVMPHTTPRALSPVIPCYSWDPAAPEFHSLHYNAGPVQGVSHKTVSRVVPPTTGTTNQSLISIWPLQWELNMAANAAHNPMFCCTRQLEHYPLALPLKGYPLKPLFPIGGRVTPSC